MKKLSRDGMTVLICEKGFEEEMHVHVFKCKQRQFVEITNCFVIYNFCHLHFLTTLNPHTL